MKGSKYEYWLDDGSIKIHEVEKNASERSGKAGLDIQASINSKGLIAAVANFFMGAAWRRSSATQGSTEKTTRIGLITTSGQNRWRIGDPRLGDARSTGGILNGTYFREKSSSEGDGEPLCTLACDGVLGAQVTTSVSASFGSIVVFAGDETPTPVEKIQGAKALLDARSKQAALRHEDALRSYVAGLVVAKAIREAQIRRGMFVAQNEFIIALETLHIPTVNDEHD